MKRKQAANPRRWKSPTTGRPTTRLTSPTPAKRRNSTILFLFAKAPSAGTVKTRLARQLGSIAAALWYRRMLARTLGVIERARERAQVSAAPSAHRYRAVIRHPGVPIVDQTLGDLGRRMGQACKTAPRASIIVGGDIPSLSDSILRAACAGVKRFDAVFGPAEDGGFYLVGLKNAGHAFRLFDDVRWSTRFALEDTLRGVPKHWRVGFLPVLLDVDEAEGLKRSPQPPANALVRMTSSPGRILREINSAGRTASDS